MTLTPFSRPAATRGTTGLGSGQREKRLWLTSACRSPRSPRSAHRSLPQLPAPVAQMLRACTIPTGMGASAWHEGRSAVPCVTGAQRPSKPGQAGWVLRPAAVGLGKGWHRAGQPLRVPGDGAELGCSLCCRLSRIRAGKSHRSLPRTPLSIAAGGGVGPASSLPIAPAQGTRRPVSPACPCHTVPRLRLPGSRSLLLTVFQAAPLSSPLARPIYSSGLFLGQA